MKGIKMYNMQIWTFRGKKKEKKYNNGLLNLVAPYPLRRDNKMQLSPV